MRLIDADALVLWLKKTGQFLKSCGENKQTLKVIGAIIDHIQAKNSIEAEPVPATSEWISVKEDLPKARRHYFIAYKFEGSDMRFYGEAMFHPEGGNGCVDRPHFSNEGVDGMYVTHWMKIPKLPLPEPPKEEEK